mmetsp:Transcript_16109/g.30955  ORF Transcript_16109/g.30955 Transcript_16109/m.30955 type:complete len:274 (-) Transcript_16109:1684-2505(-)
MRLVRTVSRAMRRNMGRGIIVGTRREVVLIVGDVLCCHLAVLRLQHPQAVGAQALILQLCCVLPIPARLSHHALLRHLGYGYLLHTARVCMRALLWRRRGGSGVDEGQCVCAVFKAIFHCGEVVRTLCSQLRVVGLRDAVHQGRRRHHRVQRLVYLRARLRQAGLCEHQGLVGVALHGAESCGLAAPPYSRNGLARELLQRAHALHHALHPLQHQVGVVLRLAEVVHCPLERSQRRSGVAHRLHARLQRLRLLLHLKHVLHQRHHLPLLLHGA